MKRVVYSIFSIALLITILCFNQKEVFAKNNINKNIKQIKQYENIVLFGDSITEYYPVEEIYGDLPVVRSGKSGYKTTDVMDKLDSMIYKYNPTSVYILLGTNDIAKNKPENKEEMLKNLKQIIKDIKTNRPMTKIYVESLLPVNPNTRYRLFYVDERKNETIKEINNDIKNYCTKNKCTYINLYDEMLDTEGYFSEDYTNDGLHPNDLGYAKITRILLTYMYGLQ